MTPARRSVFVVTALLLVVGLGAAGVILAESGLSPPLAGGDSSPNEATLGFEEVAVEQGFEYSASDDSETRVGNSRGGVFVTDYDNNGLPDVLATGGEHAVLFENTGDGFERSDALPADLRPTGALFFDHDNDGWEDLLVFEWDSSPTFFENTGGEFERRDVGFDQNLTAVNTVTTLDYDGDGCLDVFVAQTGDWRNDVPWQGATGEPYEEPGSRGGVNGGENLLYAGDCGSFEPVSDAGVGGDTHWSTATSAADFDGDGDTDIHVANDFNYDVIYWNQGDGSFEARRVPETNRHGMASDVADVNGDGILDIFVTNIRFPGEGTVWAVATSKHASNDGNSLLVGQPNGTFASMEREYGVENGGWGWAAGVVDLDNDGHDDIVQATKLYIPYNDRAVHKRGETVTPPPRVWMGTDGAFERARESQLGIPGANGRGLAHLDYDRDGDQDVVIADVNASDSFDLLENTLEGENAWLQVDLRGGDRTVRGSEVCVVTDDRRHCRAANAKADLLSQDTRVLHWGLGDVSSVTLEVTWPDGSTDTIEDVAVDRRVVVTPDGEVTTASSPGE